MQYIMRFRLYPKPLKIILTLLIFAILLIIMGCATSITAYNKGEIYLKNGDYNNAIMEYNPIIASKPNDPIALTGIGISYYAKGDFNQAVTYLQRAKSANPQHIDSYIYLGMTYEQQGKYQEALTEYNKCIALKPDSSIVKKLEKRRTFLSREIDREYVKKAIADEMILASNISAIPDNTVAITDFNNTGQIRELDLLGKGLAGMLITDLSKAKAVTVVERAKIQFLFDEMKLEGVDSKTAARPGFLLGANKIVTGSFLSLDSKSIDIVSSLTMTKTKTSKPSKSVSGSMGKLFVLEKELALGILEDMGIILTEAEKNAIMKIPTESFEAFMAYSRGLNYLDKGMYKEASQEFQKAISIDSQFSAPKEELRSVSDLTVETKNLAPMEMLRTEMSLKSQQDFRIGEADARTSRGLISTPSSEVIRPRPPVHTVETVGVEVIFP
ncbi:MAG: tetratricopeptide repeat protein [Candidatus Poribacteria bacterium]